MARNSTPTATRKPATRKPATPPAANVATTTPAPVISADAPRIAITFGAAGRPSLAAVDAAARAFDMLAHVVSRIPEPKAYTAPRNASPRVRAAIAADNAAERAAWVLLRTACANGRKVANGR